MINRKRSGTESTNSPVRKRSKIQNRALDDDSREYVIKRKHDELEDIRRQYHDSLVELSFLQGGSLIVDYYSWRNSRSEQMFDVLRTGALDDDDSKDVNDLASAGQLRNFFPLPAMTALNYSISSEFKSVDESDQEMVRFITCDQKASNTDSPKLRERSDSNKRKSETDPTSTAIVENGAINGVNDEETAQREIVEKARQEATAMQRVAQLRRDGLWSARRLPKVAEPPRKKAHWDYVLEEMQWLAVDFSQERKWKKAAARKIAYAIQKKFREREDFEKRAEREEMNRKKRIASSLARMVREWWQNIGKVVQYKQKSRLQEMRKKALDVHLNYIVDQTERFSEWLTEGMQTNSATADVSSAEDSRSVSDVDFDPEMSHLISEDDEETIAKAEEEDKDCGNDAIAELDALRQESEIPLDDLISSLPAEMLTKAEVEDMSVSEDESKEDSDKSSEEIMDDKSSDDESTMEEQEKHEIDTEGKVQEEIATLEEEAELPLDELITKYGGPDALNAPPIDDGEESSDEESDDAESTEFSDEEENESEKESSDEETEKAEDSSIASLGDDNSDPKVQLSALLSNSSEVQKPSKQSSEPTTGEPVTDNGASNVSEVERNFSALAAEAESLQPTGYTLESTEIKVRVPFLIKHKLREYQHVGLDWLATMYEKRLNGILADEMGLGKTIQTISLLAHCACEKGIWGPHLIVVPTSVMLNWELEFKKWCPAFKILTYFGSQKERKEKRKGWTKTNAFHVCITSYKLAIQDHTVFKRKKWKYLVLDEAQNIKNFKSKRWQTLLTFNSQRRLLLTGTPLQNSLMELWSLMHFLMPHVFQSHREFREWFANPLTGMIEGSEEYNELIVKRLHKVLRPFILRRLKKDVEKQMPQKYEHVVMCRLSRRQRYLYDDFMSRASTKDSLSSGHFMSVINILMQLRKVCNHPNLFEPRATISPFKLDEIPYYIPSLILSCLEYRPLEGIDIRLFFPNLVEMENNLSTFVSERVKQLKAPRKLIEEIDSVEDLPVKEPCCAQTSKSGLPKLSKPFIPRDIIKKLRAEQSAKSAEGVDQGSSSINKPQGNGIPQATQLDQLPGYIPNRRNQSAKVSDSWTTSYRISSSTVPTENQNLPPSIISHRRSLRRSQLKLMATQNDMRCDCNPVYGYNVINKLNFVGQQPVRPLGRVVSLRKATFLSRGYHNAFWAQCQRERTRGRMHWCSCSPLEAIVNRPEDHVAQLQEVVNRFIFCIPNVWAAGVQLSAPHIPNEQLNWERYQEPQLRREISPKLNILHTISRQQTVRFAEARLIQYDCGKLQTLDLLLRRLKTEDHRALIFTQMTKMLDVLEQFLSYHGHRYLRLDGTTRVEQRQALMERFNADNRIFCFILSTRSGGLGVNLTGADTVIFYDSDWNPTMDAQAQDRCHRIGQTRDVHIYRLISEKTIEENILKKANQKRFLSDVAIEGGQFTTAHFRQNTLQELFAEPSGLEDFVREKNATTGETTVSSEADNSAGDEEGEATDLERCLEECEDDTDRIAATKAKEEAKAELAEFDETIPWDEQEISAQQSGETVSKVEAELQALENELSLIERYAVNFIEVNQGGHLEDELEQAENQIEEAKRNWELDHAKALRDAEEMRAEEEEDDMLYCYGAYDITSQVRELERIKKEEYEAEEREKETRFREEARAEAIRVAKQLQLNELAQSAANVSNSASPSKRSGGSGGKARQSIGQTTNYVPYLSDEEETKKVRKRQRPNSGAIRDGPLTPTKKLEKDLINARKQTLPENLSRPQTSYSRDEVRSMPTNSCNLSSQTGSGQLKALPRAVDGRVPIPRLPRNPQHFTQPHHSLPHTSSHVTQHASVSNSYQYSGAPPQYSMLPSQYTVSQQHLNHQFPIQRPPTPSAPPVTHHIHQGMNSQAPSNRSVVNQPQIAVQLVPNGHNNAPQKSQVPLNTLLLNSQPVTLVTRQIVAPNGQVFQQRFVQPVQNTTQVQQTPTNIYSSSGLMQSLNRFNAAVSSAQVINPQPQIPQQIHSTQSRPHQTVVNVPVQHQANNSNTNPTVIIAPRVPAQTTVVVPPHRLQMFNPSAVGRLMVRSPANLGQLNSSSSHVVKILPAPAHGARGVVQTGFATNPNATVPSNAAQPSIAPANIRR